MSAADFRIYSADELRKDGYPQAWDAIGDAVREDANHRCVRCLHPYRVGEMGNGEWTACDLRCRHGGPIRFEREPDRVIESIEPSVLKRHLGPGAHVSARWRILTVHHLNGNKADCRWWNTVALCQRCHLTIQGKVKMDRPWVFTHSEWFRPYVAGHYAAKYLGEELSRQQVSDRIDDLLELEAITVLGIAPLEVASQ